MKKMTHPDTSRERRFVLAHYRPGGLDADRAFAQFRRATGYTRPYAMWRWVAVAASLLALLAVGAMVWWHEPTTEYLAQDSNREVRLPDGTQVVLAPRSALRYRGDDCRKVEITGKALLRIRHDEAHPFVIVDDNYVVHDIGTTLMVDESLGGTTVYVEEGVVSFASVEAPQQQVTLRGGEGARLGEGSRAPVRMHRSGSMTTWATGMFHYEDAPLGDVLRDLSAYYGVRLTCDDAQRRLTGDFAAESLDDIIDMIQHTLNVRISKP